MTHPTDDHIDDLVPAWLNGTLALDAQARVRAHLDRCAACRAEVAEWQVIATAVQAFADARLVDGALSPDGIRDGSESDGGTIDAIDRRIDVAERSAEAPTRPRSTTMNGTLSASTMRMPLATPIGTAHPIRRSTRRPSGWMDSLSQGLATAVVIALLVALVGGTYLREFGLPTGSGDPTRAPGLAASPEATQDGTLACSVPGYRPVVEGEVDEDALAAIGMPETPLNIDGARVNIPTSDGEIITLANTWTPIGGPMWANPVQANPAGEATLRNIETGKEWTYPGTPGFFEGMYIPPYLIVPANDNATDFRIVDTESDEEVLVSELRGERFSAPVRISPIAVDYNDPVWPHQAPVVLHFNADETAMYPGPGFPDPEAEPGALGLNALYLPDELDDARFLDNVIYAKYSHETAYSAETNQLAYATEIDGDRAIVVIEPGTDDRLVIQHPDLTADALPLMFSADGTMLVVSQPGALYTFDLDSETPSDPIFQSTFDEPVMPIAHNAESLNVLLQFPDGHVAIKNALAGDFSNLMSITVPAGEFPPAESTDRYSFETAVYDIFDDETSTVRFVDLTNGTVSPEVAVLELEATSVSAPFRTNVSSRVQYPHASWPGGHAYLDGSATLQVASTNPGGASWSAPSPAGFELAENEVARLFTTPDATCLVLQIATSTGPDFSLNPATPPTIDSASRSTFVATWIMPLDPGAEWTKLDVQLTGWFPILEEPEPKTLPAQEFATPAVFTPELQVAANGPLTMWARPDVDADVVTTLAAGTPLMALGDEQTDDAGERWVRVRTERADEGWVVERYLKPLAASAGATPLAPPTTFRCDPDTPDAVPPPVDPYAQLVPGSTISNDGIWAAIPHDGTLYIADRYIERNGDYAGWRGTKMMWTRGDGVVGPLIISGERLDAAAPAAVDLVYLDDRQYGTMGFTPAWPTFPSPGCWEITGRVGERELVFTVEVVFVDGDGRPSTHDDFTPDVQSASGMNVVL